MLDLFARSHRPDVAAYGKGLLWVLLTLKDGFEINGVLAAGELLGQDFQHHITIQLRPRIYFSVRRTDLERVEVLTVIAPDAGIQ